MTAGYELFEVEADVGVRAWAPTLAEAFAQTALGVFSLVVPPEDVAERETREVRAQGDGLEALLVSWINECLYVHEIEGFAVHRVTVTVTPAAFVHGVLHGEPIDPDRHRLGTVVKAATFHGVAVTAHSDHHETRLVVDV
jgi:SHS2 domain-containing protein